MASVKDYSQNELVISAFLNNYKVSDIVKETGFSKSLVYNIRNDPKFQRVLTERKQAIIQTAVNKMQGYMVRNAEILQEIIEDPETSPQTKVNAIKVMFDQLRDWTTTTEIQVKLETIEKSFLDESGHFRG